MSAIKRSLSLVASATMIGIILLVGCLIVKSQCQKTVGDMIFEGFGPSSSDYNVPLMNGFELWRTNSKSRFITGPKREIGPESSSHRWVDPDVQELGYDERYIVCHQVCTATATTSITEPSWWIIDTVNRKLFGPFTNEELVDEMSGLDINRIPLKSVESFAPR